MSFGNVVLLSGKRDNIPALMHEIAEDKSINHVIVSLVMEDGTMKFIHVRATGAEMAYAGAYWLKKAMSDDE